MKNWRKTLLVISFMIVAVVFLASSIFLLIAMAPTIVAAVIDRTKERLRAMTVGCVNLGFCFPYWLELVKGGHTPEKALELITPESLIIIYLGAVLGYCIEWVCVYFSIRLTRQKNKMRLESIRKEQRELVERWGIEVTGRYPLDTHGFLIKTED